MKSIQVVLVEAGWKKLEFQEGKEVELSLSFHLKETTQISIQSINLH